MTDATLAVAGGRRGQPRTARMIVCCALAVRSDGDRVGACTFAHVHARPPEQLPPFAHGAMLRLKSTDPACASSSSHVCRELAPFRHMVPACSRTRGGRRDQCVCERVEHDACATACNNHPSLHHTTHCPRRDTAAHRCASSAARARYQCSSHPQHEQAATMQLRGRRYEGALPVVGACWRGTVIANATPRNCASR